MTISRINVRHRLGEYAVLIGNGLLQEGSTLAPYHDADVLIVTDENVATRWLGPVQGALPSADALILPSGETHKRLETVQQIWERLAARGSRRDSMLLALGGGVVGDMTGFAAACWMRGIGYIQVPTTLLAQVDASVGGKTAVDLPAGKNLVGAFHQPRQVIIDTATLTTLSRREFAAGLAEVIKAALIADANFLEWLEDQAGALLADDPDALAFAIRRSCEIKAAIVSEDETEQGQRALLNLGHTFAHALETVAGYRGLLHGEAVAIGLVLAASLSEEICGLDPNVRPRVATLLDRLSLPATLPPNINVEDILEVMRLDKKHRANRWRFVLLDDVGRARTADISGPDTVRRVLQAAQGQA